MELKNIINFIFSFQFSKLIIIFETLIVSYLTYEGVQMAKMCIMNNFSGSLPWIATMVTSAWAAYGVSASWYYSKSAKEQVKKIEVLGVESPVIDFGEYTSETNENDDSIPSI